MMRNQLLGQSVTPRARVECLSKFYASGLATAATVIAEIPSASDLGSAENRG